MRTLIVTSAVLGAIAIAATGCNRQEPSPPEPMSASAPQPRAQAMSVTGCLKAGDAADTFVLTAPGTSGNAEPATYQLVGKIDELRGHVGNRVEVNGTLKSEQELASRSTAVEKDRAKGTTGTPVVETQTKVELRRLEVSSVKPIAEGCEP